MFCQDLTASSSLFPFPVFSCLSSPLCDVCVCMRLFVCVAEACVDLSGHVGKGSPPTPAVTPGLHQLIIPKDSI